MKTTATRLALAAAIATGVSGAAQSATFVGDVATFNLSLVGAGTILNSNPTIADPGVEGTKTGTDNATLSADVGASSLTIFQDLTSAPALGTSSVWTISGLETTDVATSITGLSLAGGNATLLSDFSFTASSLSVTIPDYATGAFGADNA
ncbi:MAG: hypothetical protein ACI9ZH_000420 [Paracoccaceae bacterium]|jgi:hypothetical protein